MRLNFNSSVVVTIVFILKVFLSLVTGGLRSKPGHSRTAVDEGHESHSIHSYSVVQGSNVY